MVEKRRALLTRVIAGDLGRWEGWPSLKAETEHRWPERRRWCGESVEITVTKAKWGGKQRAKGSVNDQMQGTSHESRFHA
jgi:hypothetical protein